MAHFTVYADEELTAQNIIDLFAGDNPTTVGSPNHYWSFTEGSTDFTDSIGSKILTNNNTSYDEFDNPSLSAIPQTGLIDLDFTPTAKMGILT